MPSPATCSPATAGSWLTSAECRLALTSGVSANRFERELLDHHRLVFEESGMSRGDWVAA
jgi:hypothetical protein